MEDDVKTLEETQSVPSNTEAPKEEEQRVPLSRLKEETAKRRELEARIEAMEASLSSQTQRPSDTDAELEQVIDKLDPILRRRGYLTREEKEAEDNSKAYAEEMKRLSKELDGKDGRPPFDPYEVSEFGKAHKIYNLEAAYEQMHKKELIDWHLKRNKGESEDLSPETPTESKSREANPALSREYIAQRLKKPDGHDWYEKNRTKILSALYGGEIR